MLGARIALLRKQTGLSQRSLAAALKVSPSAVGMYEQDRRTPSTELLIEMARLFDVSTDFLLTGRTRQKDAAVLNRILEDTRNPFSPDIPLPQFFTFHSRTSTELAACQPVLYWMVLLYVIPT